MKRIGAFVVFGLLSVVLAAPAFAQGGQSVKVPTSASKGDLAVALVRVASSGPIAEVTTDAALRRVQSVAVFPRGWTASDTLTQGDLAVVARSFGFTFTPTDSDRSVTSAELDTFMLREVAPRHDEVATAMGAGRVSDPILDEPPDRWVSCSDF